MNKWATEGEKEQVASSPGAKANCDERLHTSFVFADTRLARYNNLNTANTLKQTPHIYVSSFLYCSLSFKPSFKSPSMLCSRLSMHTLSKG